MNHLNSHIIINSCFDKFAQTYEVAHESPKVHSISIQILSKIIFTSRSQVFVFAAYVFGKYLRISGMRNEINRSRSQNWIILVFFRYRLRKKVEKVRR